MSLNDVYGEKFSCVSLLEKFIIAGEILKFILYKINVPPRNDLSGNLVSRQKNIYILLLCHEDFSL